MDLNPSLDFDHRLVPAGQQMQAHGNVFRALQTIQDLEFGGYIQANGAWITNYGERYRN